MKSTKKWTNALWILNVIYLIVLTWLILLKGSVSLPAFGQFRSINLIPFGASLIVNGKLDLGEIWMNILAFIPLGLYTGLLHPRCATARLLPAAGSTLWSFHVCDSSLTMVRSVASMT